MHQDIGRTPPSEVHLTRAAISKTILFNDMSVVILNTVLGGPMCRVHSVSCGEHGVSLRCLLD
jgi:hypothetical protein